MNLVFSNKTHYDADGEIAALSFILLLTMVSFIIFLYTNYLLIFHIILIHKGITTFGYIAQKKARDRDKIVPRCAVKPTGMRFEGGISMQTEIAGISFITEQESRLS